MKNNKMQDERVVAAKRKIQSDAFVLLQLGLLLSVLAQQLIFKAPTSQYIVEIVLFIMASIYIQARNIMLGNDLYDGATNRPKLMMISCIVCGLTVAVCSVALGDADTRDIQSSVLLFLVTFLIATIAYFCTAKCLYFLSDRRKKQLESQYDDTDD